MADDERGADVDPHRPTSSRTNEESAISENLSKTLHMARSEKGVAYDSN